MGFYIYTHTHTYPGILNSAFTKCKTQGNKAGSRPFQRKGRPIKLGKILNAANFTPIFSVSGAHQALPGWPGLSPGRAKPSGCSSSTFMPQIRLKPLL